MTVKGSNQKTCVRCQIQRVRAMPEAEIYTNERSEAMWNEEQESKVLPWIGFKAGLLPRILQVVPCHIISVWSATPRCIVPNLRNWTSPARRPAAFVSWALVPWCIEGMTCRLGWATSSSSLHCLHLNLSLLSISTVLSHLSTTFVLKPLVLDRI